MIISRSCWKPEFAVLNFKILNNIHNTSAKIIEEFVDERVYIYNGRTLFSIIIRDYIVGDCFGQYFRTKRFGDFHPQSVKKKKGKKKKKNKKINIKKKNNKKKNKRKK